MTIHHTPRALVKLATLLNPRTNLETFIRQQLSDEVTSLIVGVTPQYANEMTTLVKSTDNVFNRDLQILGVACDGIASGINRNGYTLGCFGRPIKIKSSEVEAPETNGWSTANSSLSLQFPNISDTIKIRTANTIFSNGSPYSLIFNRGGRNSNRLLYSATVDIPINEFSDIKRSQELEPLMQSEILTITASAGNILKRINGKPAAAYLQNNKRLLERNPSADGLRVFAEIYSGKYKRQQRYEVIGGGGEGWSSRSELLLLEPEAKFEPGDNISFYISENNNSCIKTLEETDHQKIVFQKLPKLDYSYETGNTTAKEQLFTNMFCLATEEYIYQEDIKCSIDNETIEIS